MRFTTLALLLPLRLAAPVPEHADLLVLQGDDECGADAEGCALSALQRRASARRSDAHASELRREAGQVLPPMWAMHNDQPGLACQRVTTGTCTLFSCHSWRGKTECVNGQCLCAPGTCVNRYGVCVPQGVKQCTEDAGSCWLLGCGMANSSCGSDHRCRCPAGACARKFAGACAQPDSCLKDTGGSCRHLSCHENRGPTQCIDGKCVCPRGYCAEDDGTGYGVCKLKEHPDYLAFVAAVNQDHPQFPKPHDHVVTGLSFSGGGARALSFTMGAYRALEDLGLMGYVDAIGSISGGTWASSIYMFANGTKDEILGPATSPEKLTMDALYERPAAMGRVVTQSCHSFLKRMVSDSLPSDQLWQLFIGEMILRPVGLDHRTAFMAGSQEEVERIRRENPRLKGQPFLVPRKDRPKVFVMGGAVLAPIGYKAGSDSAVLLQMSPDYTGVPFWPAGKGGTFTYEPAANGARNTIEGVTVGGGLVETFAFGGPAPTTAEEQAGGGRVHIAPPADPFTLTEAVGISSLAPAAALAAKGKYQQLVAQAAIWPVLAGHRVQPAAKYQLGDGGNVENSGLMPLLQRGARKAVMWVSTYVPLSTTIDFCKLQDAATLEKVFAGKGPDKGGLAVAPMVSDKFGYPFEDSGDYYTKHHVFPKEDLMLLLCQLQSKKKQGKPTVHRSTYQVLPNAWWGIRGGHTVDLIVVYLEQCTEFEAKLPQETRTALGPSDAGERTWATSGEFARFPRYKTVQQTEETSEVLRLTNSEVNLLAAQSEYFVRSNEAMFREVLCPDGVLGTCCRNPRSPFCHNPFSASPLTT